MMDKVISWFSSTKGRVFVHGGIYAAGFGVSTLTFLSQTFLLNTYKEIVQMYGLGTEVPVPVKVKKLFEEAIDDLKLSHKEREYINPFTVFGFDMFHAGCTHTKTGAIVGIPSNFDYESISDIDFSRILVNLDQVSWSTDAGKRLQTAMVLSEEAKKFAIGREIAHSRTYHVHFNSIYPTIITVLLYEFTVNINKKLGLHGRPLSMRVLLYTFVGIFGLGLWAFIKDFTTMHYENYVDKLLCSLGEKYIKGGDEFYTKILERNKALRILMKNKGEKLYTTTGNDQYMFRQKHVQLTSRKEYVSLQLEGLKNSVGQNLTADLVNEQIPQVIS